MANSENPTSPELQRAPATRERLQLILDRCALIVVSVSTLYWTWVRISTSDALRGTRALALPVTLTMLLVGSVLALRSTTKLRALGKVLILGCALFWLVSLYNTGGHTVYFLSREFRIVYLFKGLLCATACFTLSYMLATILQVIRRYPQQASRIFFSIGAFVIAFVSVDLWFCIDPPVEPAMVGEHVFRKQYHPVFTYAVENTFVTRDARERAVRDYNGTTLTQVKAPGVTRIVLAGASTVWGHGLANTQTLQSQLNAKLKSRLPERNWEVICLAYQGKFQLNELVDTVAVLPQWQPDLVISLNGYNEIWYGETAGRYFGQPFIDEQTKLRFSETVLGRLTHVGPVFSALGRNPTTIAGTEVDPEIPPIYYSQLRLSARVLKGLGIPYAFSFCPNVFELADVREGESSILIAADKPAAGDDRVKSVVVRERRLASDNIIQEEKQISFNVMALLQDIPGNRFLDECHLTAEATDALASRLADQVPGWLAKP